MKNLLHKSIIISLLVLSPVISFAMTETTTGGQLSAEISPTDPGPFTDTSVNLVSYDVDLSHSNIIWTINGQKQKEGIGANNLQLTTGPVGKKILINIEVLSQDGKDITKEISMIPEDVDLLWQSNGYVPPFYEGKSEVVAGGDVKLLALPNFVSEDGSKIDASKLIYNWRTNGEIVSSGYGQSFITTSVDESLPQDTFAVDVSSTDDIMRASKIINLRPHLPVVLLYETNPLSGTIFQKSLLNSIQMNAAEMTVIAEPYFFNTKDLGYLWSVNNEPPSADLNSKQLTVRQPSGSGESLLNILINSASQSAQMNLIIKFGRTANF
ncbi:MAG: hypothetical protein HY226_06470 [Candidatus Vogelbacteria bacterium]|nr:hypothetical protein [Candidatus Vogelbacteria bacterium]